MRTEEQAKLQKAPLCPGHPCPKHSSERLGLFLVSGVRPGIIQNEAAFDIKVVTSTAKFVLNTQKGPERPSVTCREPMAYLLPVNE